MGATKPIVWTGEIRSGKIHLTFREDFDRYHSNWKDGPIELITRRVRKSGPGPTDQQRKYYWPVIVAMFAVLWGCDPDEAHETLLIEYATARREPGKPIDFKRTSEMEDPMEVETYYAWCRRRGAQDGCRIPLPNEVLL